MAANFDQRKLRITIKACVQLLLPLSIFLSLPTYAAEKISTDESSVLAKEIADNDASTAQPAVNEATNEPNNGLNSTSYHTCYSECF